MKIGNVLSYGMYDSKKVYPNEKQTTGRPIVCFEFDFFISCDKDAMSFVNEKSCKLYPNVLVVRKPGQTAKSILHFKTYYIHIEIPQESPLYEELSRLPNFFSLINPSTYREIFEQIIYHNLKNTNAFDDHFTAAKLLELFYHLIKDAPQNINKQKLFIRKENESIQKAISYMKNNFEEKISLEILGDLTGYSPNHFRFIFTEITGVSPQKYLENIRLSRAKYMLAQNELSIAEIAYACGFSSQAYFSLLFKRETMLTPNEFRRSALSGYPD